jgi:membrane associated rhomboid family serine protease
MSVDRLCDCGAVIPAYVLGCKTCGRTYKVRDEYLVGKDILSEPPVELWARDLEHSKTKKGKVWRRKKRNKTPKEDYSFQAELIDHLVPNPNKNSYNIFVGFFLIVILLLVPYFSTQLISDPRVLPYSILALTTLITIQAIRKPVFYRNLLLIPNLVFSKNEFYRLITSGFSHINGTHLLLNGIAIFCFGPPLMQFLIEVYGELAPIQFIVFYFVSICFADFPDLIRHRNNVEYSSVGASGATSAIVAAAAVADPGLQITFLLAPTAGDAPSIPGIVYAIGFLLISLFFSFRRQSGVAHLAHATGTVFGFLAVAVISTQFQLNLYGKLVEGIKNGDLTSVSQTYTRNDSMLIQLNGRGSDVWSKGSLDTWQEWGAKTIYSSQNCSVIIFQSTSLANEMFSDWENVGLEGYYAWNIDDVIVIGPNAESSCIKTSARVLGVTLTN